MTRTAIRFEKGKKYRVTGEGATLAWNESIGVNCWQGKKEPLPVGSVIEFIEYKNCWGSDPVPVANFTRGNTKGEFWPNDWGVPEDGYLEEVDEQP